MTAEQRAGWDGELSEPTDAWGRLFQRAGHVTPDRTQWLLNGSVWDDPLPRHLKPWAAHRPTPPITDPQDLRL